MIRVLNKISLWKKAYQFVRLESLRGIDWNKTKCSPNTNVQVEMWVYCFFLKYTNYNKNNSYVCVGKDLRSDSFKSFIFTCWWKCEKSLASFLQFNNSKIQCCSQLLNCTVGIILCWWWRKQPFFFSVVLEARIHFTLAVSLKMTVEK